MSKETTVADLYEEISALRKERDTLRLLMVQYKTDRAMLEAEHRKMQEERDRALSDLAAERERREKAERRADEMEGKAGEWIAVDVHRERVAAAVARITGLSRQREVERDAARARVALLEGLLPKCEKCNGSGAVAFDGDVLDCEACEGTGHCLPTTKHRPDAALAGGEVEP